MDLGTDLVTGGASGLGAAVALAVAGAGGTLVLLDRVAPALDADHEIVDLVDRRAAEPAVGRIVERHPGLRAVVTAAGTDACGRIEDVDAEDWERVVMVNLLGTAAVVRPEDVADAVLFALRQPPGCEVRELVVCPSLESSWP